MGHCSSSNNNSRSDKGNGVVTSNGTLSNEKKSGNVNEHKKVTIENGKNDHTGKKKQTSENSDQKGAGLTRTATLKDVDLKLKNWSHEDEKESGRNQLKRRKSVKIHHVDIRHIYKFEKKIGEGSFGKVRSATRLDNPSKLFAIKSMSKAMIKDQSLLEKELEILASLDHPNIIKFFEYYQDNDDFHIVMELCTGPELFDRAQVMSSMDEISSQAIVYKIVRAIHYSHLEGIIHRDLKLENIMFENPSHDAQIKIIDWGLSAKFVKDQTRLTTVTGTPQFIAPEVFQGTYDAKCDIWSIGVITYVILAWKYPYKGSNVGDYRKSLVNDEIFYEHPGLVTCTKNCIDFIKGCLKQNPSERMTIQQCFEHPWFDAIKKRLISKGLDINVMNNLRRYSSPKSKLQVFIEKHFINLLFSLEDIKALRDQFESMDLNGQGFISLDELKAAYKKAEIEVDDDEVTQILRRIDRRQNNMIDYSEFLIAAIDESHKIDKTNLIKVFNYFDEDNSGFIDISNLKSLLLRTMHRDKMPSDSEFQEIITESSRNTTSSVLTQSDFLRCFGYSDD